jgi:hypothetical protein
LERLPEYSAQYMRGIGYGGKPACSSLGHSLQFFVSSSLLAYSIDAGNSMKLNAFGYARLLAVALILLPLVLRYSVNAHHIPLPSGYFILLRWIVCPVLTMTAYLAYKSRSHAWTWIYGVDAALFNPIFIVRLGLVWEFADWLTVALILASFALKFGRKANGT